MMNATARVHIPGLALLAALGATVAAMGLLAGVNPALAVAASVGIAFVLVVVSDLAVGLCVFTLVSFIEVLPIEAGPLSSATKLIGLLLALSWLALMTSRIEGGKARDLLAAHPGLSWMLFLFLGWAVFSLLWVESFDDGQRALSRYALNAILFPIVFAAIRKPRHVVWIAWALLAGALISAGYGLISPADPDAIGRLAGAGVNPNDLATLLVVGLIIGTALAATSKRAPAASVAAAVAAALCGAALFLTLSRSGLLALAVALISGLLVASRRRGRMAAIALIAVTGVVGYFGFLAPPEARERITTVGSGTGRTDLWKVGWRMVEARPIVGVGVGNFDVASAHYVLQPGTLDSEALVASTGQRKVAHNIYLETWAELGIVGLILFVGIVGIPLATTLAAARRFLQNGDTQMETLARALFAAQAGMLAAAFFASIQFNKQLWLLLALGPALLALSRSSERSSPAV